MNVKCNHKWHPGHNVVIVDIGGFAHLWCADCQVLANLEAVADKIKPDESFEYNVDVPKEVSPA